MSHATAERRRTNTLWCSALLTLLLSTTPASVRARESTPEPLPLAWCLERAIIANPEIHADEAAARAAAERIVPAGALEDPRISYEASNLPVGDFDFESTPLSGNQLGLSQKFPFPGLLRSRADAARAGSAAAELSLSDRRRVVVAQVESAWAELGFAQRALEITDRNIELLRQLTRIAEAKYRVGTGLQQDVLRAQVELTVLLEERLRREAAIETASASLAALLDLAPGTELPRTASLEDASPLPDLDGLIERLEQTSPRLRAREARVREAERLRRAAELEGLPEFEFGLGYRIRQNVSGDPVDGDDFVSAGVRIGLPIHRGKWRARTAERAALLRRAQALYRAEHAQLSSRMRAAHAELSRADAESALLETGLVPQARQSLESSRSGYEVGRIDFLGLLDSQVQLLNAELRRVRAVADRRVAFTRLEAAAGEALR